MELRHVGVSESRLSSESAIRVELQKAAKEVKGVVACSWEHVSQTARLAWRQTLKHCWRQRTINCFNIVAGGSSGDFHDTIELIERGSAREDWLSEEKFSEDAPQRPHVHAFGVVVRAE